MGMFSWICSDSEHALVCHDIRKGLQNCTKDAFLLIPKEFGGGSYKVKHNYEGYGEFYDDDGNAVDAYSVLAKWNGLGDDRSDGIDLYFTPKDKNISKFAKGNYNTTATMKYPLKIVQYEVPYESAKPCWDDPNQGWGGN